MRVFYLVVACLTLLVAQAVFAPRMSIGSIAPDFVLVMAIVFALYRGAVAGALFGFLVGFIVDLGNPSLLGLNAMLTSILGYVIGRAAAKTFSDSIVFVFLIFLVAVFGRDVIYLFFFTWPNVLHGFVSVFTVALPSAIYTGLIGVLVHHLLQTYGSKAVRKIGKEG